MAKLDFPDASYSPWVAPNNVIYTYIGTSPNGYWEANTANASTNLTSVFVERAGSTMTGALKLDNAGSVSLPDISFDGDVNTGLYSPGAESLAIATAGTQRVTVDSSGRVLVGTTTANGNMTVNMGTDKNISFTGGISEVGSVPALQATNTSGSSLASMGFRATDLRFATGSAERMRIDSSGKVGIGTNDPNAKLYIKDDTNYTPSLTYTDGSLLNLNYGLLHASIGISSQAPYPFYIQNKDTSGNARNITLNPNGGNVGIGTSSPYTDLVVLGTGSATTTSVDPSEFTATIQTDSAYLNFGKVNGQPTIQGSGAGTSYHLLLNPFNGNVGIGTSSAAYKVDVTGTSTDLLRLAVATGTTSTPASVLLQGTTQSGSSSNQTILSSREITGAATATGTTEFGINVRGVGDAFGSPGRVATFLGTGNVGIGTSSPQAKLQVAGAIVSSDAHAVAYTQTGAYLQYLGSSVANIAAYRSGNSSCELSLSTTTGTGNPVEKVRISAAGNVGIGTTAPTARLTQVGGRFHNNRPSSFWSSADYIDIAGYGSLTTQGSFELDLQCNGYRNASGTWTTLYTNNQTGAAKISLNPVGFIKFSTQPTKTNGSSAGITERARYHQDGSYSYANASINPVASNVVGIAFRTSGNIITCMQSVNAPHQFRRNNDGDIIRFYRNSTTDCGAIRVTSGTTHFDTSSDYRLKENMVAITDGIDRVKQLQPKRFNFIEFPENTVDGFIAHEAKIAVPEAVSGEKDGTEDQEYEVTPAVLDEEGNVTEAAIMGTRTVPKYQAIDKSKLVPLLTAALQEAIAKIETLEQRLSDAGIA